MVDPWRKSDLQLPAASRALEQQSTARQLQDELDHVLPLVEVGRGLALECLEQERCGEIPLQGKKEVDKRPCDTDAHTGPAGVVQRREKVDRSCGRSVVEVDLTVVVDEGQLSRHSSGRSGVPGRPSGKSSASRRATGPGTSSETSPPNAAISFTPLEETKLTCGLAMTYTVSTSGASVRLSWFIWNSHSKSEMTRRPLTIAFASHLRAKSTTNSRKTSISTLPRPERASRRNSIRSSTVNVGCLWWGVPTTPTTTRSKIPAARVITSTCPFVTGSYEPGAIAVITAAPRRA